MIRICISLFLSGVVLGAGPCLTSCGPLLISYIAASRRNPKEGLAVWLWFSLARICAYLALAALVALASEFFNNYFHQAIARYVYLLGGLFVFLVGIAMILGKDFPLKACNIFSQQLVEKWKVSPFVFGLIIGFLPCAPLVSLLIYVGLISKTWASVLLYSLCFSLGTLFSPLVLLAFGAGFIPRLISQNARYYRIFKVICGVVICVLGVNLIRNFLR